MSAYFVITTKSKYLYASDIALQCMYCIFSSIIGVARIFDWGGPNHKSHAMASSEIFEKITFCGAKIS